MLKLLIMASNSNLEFREEIKEARANLRGLIIELEVEEKLKNP